jgi:NADH-quinone oxidoreductase subunit J
MTDLVKDVLGDPVFCACALVSLAGAMTVVLRRNPVYSALGLMAAFLAFAVIFVKLNATFLAAMHVLVYTGAILVLFLFVIMLLNLSEKELGAEHPRAVKGLLAVAAAALVGVVSLALWKEASLRAPVKPLAEQRVVTDGAVTATVTPEAWGGVEHVAQELFRTWIFPFELVSALIVVAILGAVVLAKKKLPPEV